MDQPHEVQHMLDHIQKLPALPSLVLDILQSFNDEDVDVSTLAHKIACDQAIAARVLRVANSPFFGLSGQIGSIPEAVAVLGINNLRGLVTGAAVINAFSCAQAGFDWKVFWRHSIDTAVCAKVLARYVRGNEETAFTAGLLHDLGKLLISVHYPTALGGVNGFMDACTPERLQAERDALGIDHAELGGKIAELWRFPKDIRDAIARHHAVMDQPGGIGLADLVHVANQVAHGRDGMEFRAQLRPTLADLLSARLGLGQDKLDSLPADAQQLYSGAVALIN
jgi:putative nucleotidyltransferase with HDIG domain